MMSLAVSYSLIQSRPKCIDWNQVHHVTDNRLLSPWQCGGFPGQEAHTPVLLEELSWEITRTSRPPLLRMDFDTSSCYD
jgi:hypothetical protein